MENKNKNKNENENKNKNKERRGPDSEPKKCGILKYLSAEISFEKSVII